MKTHRNNKITVTSVCLQSTAIMELQGGAIELDSDMADITQSFPTESMLGGEEDSDLLAGETDTTISKLGGLASSELDGVSASGHIASTLGINPHTLQVQLWAPPTGSASQGLFLNDQMVNNVRLVGNGFRARVTWRSALTFFSRDL